MSRRSRPLITWAALLSTAPLAGCHLLLGLGPGSDGGRGERPLVDGHLLDAREAADVGRPCAWQYRRRLVFRSPPAEALTSFPALVKLEAPSFDFKKTAGAKDLRFISRVGQAPFEVEQWSPTAAAIWVLVPSVDDQLWMYYGHPSPSPPPRSAFDVWPDGYLAVWHMTPAPPTATMLASSTGPVQLYLSLSKGVSLEPKPGLAGSAVWFDGKKYLTAQLPGTTGPSRYTLEVCFWVDHVACIGCEAHLVELSHTQLMLDTDRKLDAGTGEEFNAEQQPSSTPVTLKSWHCAAFVQAGAPAGWELYLDGVLQATGSEQTAPGNRVFVGDIYNDLTRPSYEGATELIGLVDEVRISSVPRSAAWVAASHQSMAGLLLGPEEMVPAGACPE